MGPIRVDVWSDIACPWCWVGKRHLEAALDGGPPVEVAWRAFELNPRAPASPTPGVSYVQRLARKYGVSEAEGKAMVDRMTEVGASVGLAFRFDRVTPTNTFDAHRLVRWAGDHGTQEAMKERLFRAYMSEGMHLADHEVLAAQAAQVGLDPDEARAVLSEGRFSEDVRTDEAFAAELQVSGVPFFVFGGRYAVAGAQPREVLRGALEQAVEAAAGGGEAAAGDVDAPPSAADGEQ